MKNFCLSPGVCKKLGQMALIFLLLIALAGCKSDKIFKASGGLKVSGGNPPTFDPDGSGNVAFFWVREASWDELKLTPLQRGIAEDKLIVWEIWPAAADTKIADLPNITYGQVPPGFRQTIPDHGTAPPLVEGMLYKAGGPAAKTNGRTIYFTIQNGQAIEVSETYQKIGTQS